MWLVVEWTVRSSMVYHSVRSHSFLCICLSKRRNWNWLVNALLTCIAHNLRMENAITPYNVTSSRRTRFFYCIFLFLVLKTITKHVIQIFRLLQDMHILRLIKLNAFVHANCRKIDEKAVKNRNTTFFFRYETWRAARSAANRSTQSHCVKGKLVQTEKTIVIRH